MQERRYERRIILNRSFSLRRYFRTVLLFFLFVLVVFFQSGCAGIEEEKPDIKEKDVSPVLDVEPYESISASMSAGNPEEAVKKFEDAYSENPDSTETRLLYASLLITTGQAEKAETVIVKILEEDPKNPEALYNLSLIKGMRNERPEQKELLQKVIAADSGHAEAYASLGELYLEDEEYDSAEENFQKSIQEDPQNFIGRSGYGHVLLRQKKYAEAEEQFDQAVQIEPEYPYSYIDRARARSGAGDINGAILDLSTAMELDPDYYWNYIDRGKLYLHTGNYEGALEDFNQAVIIDPDYFLGYVYQAGILDDLGKEEPAYNSYRKLITLRDDYYPAYEPLALFSFSNEKYLKAAEYFDRHYQRFSKDYGHALMSGISLLFAGEKEKGAAYLKKYMDIMPRETYMYDIARLFTENGYDNYFISKLVNETNITIKVRALYYLAAYYKLQGQTRLANRYFLEVKDANIYGLYETDLAIEELSDKIEEQ